jgi:hypothetical protein
MCDARVLSSFYLAEPAITNVGLCYPLESQRVCFVWRPNSVCCLPESAEKSLTIPLPKHTDLLQTFLNENS